MKRKIGVFVVAMWVLTVSASAQPVREVIQPRDVGSLLRSRDLNDRFLLDPRRTELAGGIASVPLDVRDEEVDRYDLLLQRPNGWEAGSMRRNLDNGELKLQLGEAVILRPNAVDVAEATVAKSYFAGEILQAARGETDEVTLNRWKLFLQTGNDTLTWSAADHAYAATLHAGIDATTENGTPVPLPHPVLVRFFTEGAGVRVEPDQVTIEESGTRGYKQSQLLCQGHVVRPAVTAKAPLGEKRWDFKVGRRLAQLELIAAKKRVLGLGLEATDLVVRQFAEDGELLTGAARTVSLHGDGGHFPSTVTIPEGAAEAQVQLRSAGIGEATLSAASGAIRSPPVTVHFKWPLALIALCALGGIVGGLIRAFLRHRAGEGGWYIGQSFVGLVVGIVVVGAVATGLTSFGFAALPVITEIGALVVAVVAGYAGNSVLAALARAFGFGGTDNGDLQH
ncbi:MAG: hypothetical protein KY475_20030 [Planctomycetes bacterium]|nr:hypothetical protein [Planctomycetota bacterium]